MRLAVARSLKVVRAVVKSLDLNDPNFGVDALVGYLEQNPEDSDPSEVVIDEVIGQWIATLPIGYAVQFTQTSSENYWIVWLWASVAVAAEDLAWNWVQPEAIQYNFDVSVRTPFAVEWIDVTAGETSALQHQLNMSSTCNGEATKKGWKVICSVD